LLKLKSSTHRLLKEEELYIIDEGDLLKYQAFLTGMSLRDQNFKRVWLTDPAGRGDWWLRLRYSDDDAAQIAKAIKALIKSKSKKAKVRIFRVDDQGDWKRV
jgi:hypothetical protein